jgi:hypothetical protein
MSFLVLARAKKGLAHDPAGEQRLLKPARGVLERPIAQALQRLVTRPLHTHNWTARCRTVLRSWGRSRFGRPRRPVLVGAARASRISWISPPFVFALLS